MIVVSDTSPLLYAVSIGCENLFPLLFETVLVPPAVNLELQSNPDKKFVQKIAALPWLRVQNPSNLLLVNRLKADIDAGESEAIALALDTSPDFLIIDERRGNKIANQYRLNTVGFLGVLLLAKNAGHLPLIKPLIEQLYQSNQFPLRSRITQERPAKGK